MEIILNIDEDFYTKEELAEFDNERIVRGRTCWYHSDNRDADYQVRFCTLHNCKADPAECWCWLAREA